jgi:hypothetical protein
MSITAALRRPAARRRAKSAKRAGNLAGVLQQRWQRGVVNAVGVGGVWIFAAWKVPMGLPGHRALGWLTLLLLVRLLAGPGRAASVGLFAAALVLVTGISPNGIWGVAQYAIAGALIETALLIRPSMTRNAVSMTVLGALVLLSVGWIAPLGRSMTGGIPMTEIWPSFVSLFGAGLSRLFVLDLAFGASAGLVSFGLARLALRARHPMRGLDMEHAPA